MTVLIGTSSAGVDSANSNLSQTAFAVRLVCANSGDVDFLFLKTPDVISANQHGALYADNAGALTGATRLSGDITGPTIVSGWHRYTVSPAITVVSGVFYWLEFVRTDTTYGYTDNATSGGTERDTTGTTTLAATHATTTGSFTNRFNAYADGTLATVVGQVFFPRRMPLGA